MCLSERETNQVGQETEMNQEIAKYANEEDGYEIIVTKISTGFSVRLLDECGLFLDDIIIFPPDRRDDALVYAKNWAEA